MSDPQIGTIVGERYRLLRPLGRGGMGTVYAAQDLTLQREVAIKALHVETREMLERFAQEAMTTAQMGHPHVVPVLDFIRAPRPYIVMELLQGETLASHIRREGALTQPAACFLAVQVLSALQAAHERGIIHRDIKPSNIFLVASPATRHFAKVLDFGIAKNVASAHATQTGSIIGTVPYMAPEQIRGEAIDGRCDIFSVGCMLYEALSGRRPFADQGEAQVMHSILSNHPLPPIAHIDPTLMHVVFRARAYDRDARFATAADMIRALAPFAPRLTAPGVSQVPHDLLAQGHSAPPTTPHLHPTAASAPPSPATAAGLASSPPTAGSVAAVYTPQAATSPPRRRWPWALAVFGFAALSVGGYFAYVFRSTSTTLAASSPEAPSATKDVPPVPALSDTSSAAATVDATVDASMARAHARTTPASVAPASATPSSGAPSATATATPTSTATTASGACVCLPILRSTPVPVDGYSVSLTPTFAGRKCQCNGNGSLCPTPVQCTAPNKCTKCTERWVVNPQGKGAQCTGWNPVSGRQETGQYRYCQALGERRVYPGPADRDCTGYQSDGVRLHGVTVCN